MKWGSIFVFTCNLCLRVLSKVVIYHYRKRGSHYPHQDSTAGQFRKSGLSGQLWLAVLVVTNILCGARIVKPKKLMIVFPMSSGHFLFGRRNSIYTLLSGSLKEIATSLEVFETCLMQRTIETFVWTPMIEIHSWNWFTSAQRISLPNTSKWWFPFASTRKNLSRCKICIAVLNTCALKSPVMRWTYFVAPSFVHLEHYTENTIQLFGRTRLFSEINLGQG